MPREFSSLYKNIFFFTMRIISDSLEQPPQGHSSVPITGRFKGAFGTESSHLGSVSHKRLYHMLFQGPFQSGPFYDSNLI